MAGRRKARRASVVRISRAHGASPPADEGRHVNTLRMLRESVARVASKGPWMFRAPMAG